MEPTALLSKLISGNSLSQEETRGLFDAIMDNQLDPTLMGGLLSSLATKGETVDEIVGAAEAMRSRVSVVQAPAGTEAIDTCGTGGDGKPVFNVSTAVAIVSAAAGAIVAKHGNRSNARPSGSAEVLGVLGVNLDAEPAVLARCLQECRVAFLYAVRLHPAMKHAAPVRRALGIRTIFNLVGPLTNPAGVKRQLLGVSRSGLVETMVDALRRLGAQRAMVVHGLEGLCDLSIAGPSRVGRWDGQQMTVEELDCSVIGATPGRLEDLYVQSPEDSAARIRAIFDGEPGIAREMVVFNASAALWVAGLANDWQAGADAARRAIDSGAARKTLDAWSRISHET